MNADRARAFILTLPHVVETMQWGDNLVFWVADKSIGGKMFALISLNSCPSAAKPSGRAIISFAAGRERFAELLEIEGLVPAPYMARNHWIAAERWDAFRPSEWESQLRHAYSLTLSKLPTRTRDVLNLPQREQQRVVAARRKLLSTRFTAKVPSRRR